jgi:hypothetical protein
MWVGVEEVVVGSVLPAQKASLEGTMATIDAFCEEIEMFCKAWGS